MTVHRTIVTPLGELTNILKKQKREQEWWQNYSTMHTLENIEYQIQCGRAQRIMSNGSHYQMSCKIPDHLRVVRNDTLARLNQISKTWYREMQHQLIPCNDLFLVVTSLGRTVEYQKDLIRRGYPAAEESTHTKLGAFDIGFRWFLDNKHNSALKVLDRILWDLNTTHRINWIPEPSQGVYHIAHNPAYQVR